MQDSFQEGVNRPSGKLGTDPLPGRCYGRIRLRLVEDVLGGEQAGRRATGRGDVAKVGREDLHVRDVAAGGEHGPVRQQSLGAKLLPAICKTPNRSPKPC